MNNMNQQFQSAPLPPPQPQQTANQNMYAQRLAEHNAALQTQNTMFCKDCGNPVDRNASVCIHCGYVLNPESFAKAQQMVQQRAQRDAPRKRLIGLIGSITGDQRLIEESREIPLAQRTQYRFQTVGKIYCTSCGGEVEEGQSICMHCGYVLNPTAIRNAQMMIQNRNMKLERSDLIKSYLIPGYGKKMYEEYKDRCPQIAEPCQKAGKLNKLALIAIIALIILL
ncbi:MAG: hypothetical protein IK130_01860 [Oscillospiraceae bacterium]|nr:hypothetical protein [Oscillospiraceae bacterium]